MVPTYTELVRAQPTSASQRKLVLWTRLNFMGLFPKSGKDQWDYKIGWLLHSSPATVKFVHLHLSIRTIWAGLTQKGVLAQETRLSSPDHFLLVRECSLGIRLWQKTQTLVFFVILVHVVRKSGHVTGHLSATTKLEQGRRSLVVKKII